IGFALRPVIASRYWIVLVLLLACLLYIPLVVSGFFQDDYGFRLEFSPYAQSRVGWTEAIREVTLHGPLNLYGFTPDSPLYFVAGRDKGFMPWWASDRIRTNFFRPLSSLSLALDFTLWPDMPLPLHLHSLLWFILFLVLAYRLYRSVSGSMVVAGLASLLLAVDDVFTGPAGWISNRHAMIAMTFGVLSVWLCREGAVRRKGWLIAGASSAYAIALLASEMGLVTFAYLFACLLVLDDDRWINRVSRLLPFLLITIFWRVMYSTLGYGASGSLLYIDPILNPVDFVTQALARYPLVLSSAAGLPILDLMIAMAPHAQALTATFTLIPLGLLVLAAFPVLKQHRAATFWLIGLLCAGVPLVSGIPGNRNLGFVSLGVMGLVGQLLVDVARMGGPALLNRFQVILLRISVPMLLVLHLLISPYFILSNASSTQASAREQVKVVDFGSDPALAGQHLQVINPPGEMIYVAGLMMRLFTTEPMPASINYLTSGFSPVRIERLDDRTIVVTPEGGYTPQPGAILDEASGLVTEFHLENVYRALEGLFYNPRDPLRVGDRVMLHDVTGDISGPVEAWPVKVRIEVTGMTGDGRITQAMFSYTHPLDDPRYVWLWWDKTSATYEQVQMPAVGESRLYE
ncbi:MAG: hypothetical protein IT326_04950, partial [Anaerolineae bacterium]|nr:hypothetical protein [Anaerolineae bacterium]